MSLVIRKSNEQMSTENVFVGELLGEEGLCVFIPSGDGVVVGTMV